MDKPKTIKVRIALAVDPTGRYWAKAFHNGNFGWPAECDELLEKMDFAEFPYWKHAEAFYWVTVEVPIPAPKTLKGRVRKAKKLG